MYVNIGDPIVRKIAAAAYPDYRGRKIQVKAADKSINVKSYWDGGSRSYFVFVRLADMNVSKPVPAQHPVFDPQIPNADHVQIPEGVACVAHSIFCGKDLGLTVYVNPANLNQGNLPAPAELTADEKSVLKYSKSLKASYGGVSNYRFHEANRETGITAEAWDAAKASLQAKGYLDKRGAVTIKGRNL